MTNNTVLSTAEVAVLLKVNESTVKRWTDKGTLRCFKTPGGHRKYSMTDVNDFIERFGFEIDAQVLGVRDFGTTVSTDYAILTKNYPVLISLLRESLLRGDPNEAYQFLRLLLANRYALTDLYDRVVAEALRQIGVMWAERTVGIDQEHIATNCMLSALRLLQTDTPAKAAVGLTALCGCFEGEFHEVGIICVRNILDTEGWTTYYAGPNLPVGSFIQAIERYRPNLVCVSGTTPKTKFQFHRDCALVHEAARAVSAKFIVGGSAALHPGKSKIPADYVPSTIADTLAWMQAEVQLRKA
jgi:MerR family transcriptional regulator, light-induced transcriptional regulator